MPSNEPSPLKAAIMDAVYVPLERDDMQTPCELPFMTSSEYGVCDGDGCPVSDETIASALNAVAKIQTEYYKVKKETQKGIQKGAQKEMTNEPNPRPWRVEENVVGWHSFIVDANGDGVAACWRTARGDDEKERQYNEANARLIVDAVNERDHLHDQLASALRLADECSRDAAAVHAGRARAVEEAQSEANRRADRLADIVRRTVETLEQVYKHADMTDALREVVVETQREARAAIGEGQP